MIRRSLVLVPLALLLGPALHVGGDHVPHEDIPDRSFEIGSGLFTLGLLAARRGPFDPAVLGGAVLMMTFLGVVPAAIPARRAVAVDPSKLMREE